MTSSEVDVILLKLEHLESMLFAVHEEVKRTNGRVTDLELEEAKWQGAKDSRRMQQMIVATVISGGILAGVIWFVTQAI